MNLTTISEFQRLSGLSDSAMLWLLKNNKFRIEVDQDRGIMLDTDSLELQETIKAITAQKKLCLERKKRIMIEKCAALLGDYLEDIAQSAISNSLKKTQGA